MAGRSPRSTRRPSPRRARASRSVTDTCEAWGSEGVHGAPRSGRCRGRAAVTRPTRIGILGCGVISGIYIENSRKLEGIELVAVADVNPAAARYRADQYGVGRALSPEELLADPEIEIVINLTPNR